LGTGQDRRVGCLDEGCFCLGEFERTVLPAGRPVT
jgi:hypothetical protein